MLDEIEDVLLGDAAAGAGATHFCEIHIVLAGEFADERGRANVGIFFGIMNSGGGRWRRSRSFFLCGSESGRSAGEGGRATPGRARKRRCRRQ